MVMTGLAPPPGLAHWTDLLAAVGAVVQDSPGRTRQGWGDWRRHDTTTMTLDEETDWDVLDGGDVDERTRFRRVG